MVGMKEERKWLNKMVLRWEREKRKSMQDGWKVRKR